MADDSNNHSNVCHVVIVGGGAGGLVLATRLAHRRLPDVKITLVDAAPTHIWKPLLHEIAAGSLDANADELSYIAHGARVGYEFQLGCLQAIDRSTKTVVLAPIRDENGEESVAERRLGYDVLVIAIGSVSNDFGTKGAGDYCLQLDTRAQADRFHQRFLNIYLAAHARKLNGGDPPTVNIVIIGAGATGVELAAELHASVRKLIGYGLNEIPSQNVRIAIVEAGTQLLPSQPAKLAAKVEAQLRRLGIDVHLDERVTEVARDGVKTQSGKFIPGTLMVWAAGIKAPPVLAELGGLEVNRLNQLQLRSSLQTTLDDHVFAIGDCSTLEAAGTKAPPTAQLANQQALHLAAQLPRFIRGEAMSDFQFTSAGTVVPLGESSTFGVLMGNLLGTHTIQGFIARLTYLMLYRRHQLALYGAVRTALIIGRDLLRRSVGPRLKLH